MIALHVGERVGCEREVFVAVDQGEDMLTGLEGEFAHGDSIRGRVAVKIDQASSRR